MSTGALLELLWGAGLSAPYTHMKPPLGGIVVNPALGGQVDEISYSMQAPPPGLDTPVPPVPPVIITDPALTELFNGDFQTQGVYARQGDPFNQWPVGSAPQTAGPPTLMVAGEGTLLSGSSIPSWILPLPPGITKVGLFAPTTTDPFSAGGSRAQVALPDTSASPVGIGDEGDVNVFEWSAWLPSGWGPPPPNTLRTLIGGHGFPGVPFDLRFNGQAGGGGVLELLIEGGARTAATSLSDTAPHTVTTGPYAGTTYNYEGTHTYGSTGGSTATIWKMQTKRVIPILTYNSTSAWQAALEGQELHFKVYVHWSAFPGQAWISVWLNGVNIFSRYDTRQTSGGGIANLYLAADDQVSPNGLIDSTSVHLGMYRPSETTSTPQSTYLAGFRAFAATDAIQETGNRIAQITPNFRYGRGPMLPKSFIEVDTVESNSLDSNSFNIINAGVGGVDMTHKGIVYQANTFGAALTVANGFSPKPILDEGTNTPLVPVALVTANGNMTFPLTTVTGASTKARVLQQIGAPVPPNYVRAGSTDDPATIYSPNVSLTDPTTGAIYDGMLWDLNRLRSADYTWNNFGTPRSVFTAAASTTSGNATITVPGGNFTANDVGLLVTGTGIQNNSYIKTFISSTQVTLNFNATASNPAVNLTFTPVRPSTMGFQWECQNMVRTLDLQNNPGYPVDRYPNATLLSQLAVAEVGVWGVTATKLPLSPLMLLKEDVDRFVDSDPTTWPRHALGISLPLQPGTHIWPAQAHDATIHFDTAALPQEGQRFRMPRNINPPSGAHILHKFIHRVAQTFGLVFWDTGGAIAFRCDPALASYIVSPQTTSNVLNGFQWSKLEVLAVGTKANPNP